MLVKRKRGVSSRVRENSIPFSEQVKSFVASQEFTAQEDSAHSPASLREEHTSSQRGHYISGYTKMESRGNCQLLLSLTLLSAFCSQTLALHSETYSAMSRLGNGTLFDGPNEPERSSLPENELVFEGNSTSLNKSRRQDPSIDLSQYLEGEAAEEFVEAIAGKVCDYCKKNHAPERRHIDGIFTHSYRKHQLKKAVREYLRKVLGPRLKKKEKDSE